MDLQEFKLKKLGIDKEKFGRIFSFIDFGNVNYWYEKDRRDFNDNLLPDDQKLIVGIEKLSEFVNLFSEQKRFYYGLNMRDKSSWHITTLADRYGFRVSKKPIQWVKNYFDNNESQNLKFIPGIKKDKDGFFIEMPKCNFDVEITIDAIRLIEHFDAFALFSGDSDFSMLLRFLRNEGKKIILFYAGRISYSIENYADLLVNAQKIKSSICILKEIKKNPV